MIKNRYEIHEQGVLIFEHAKISRDIMDWLCDHGSEFYECLRGPRPSAALIDPGHSRGKIFTVGFVTPPEGSKSCKDIGECMIEDGHCVRNNHAEVDALLRCAKYSVSTLRAICYSINKPCYQCTRALIAAGIQKIYYRYAVYDEERTKNALEAANVEAIQI